MTAKIASRLPNLSLKVVLLDRVMESFRVELDSPSGVHFPGQIVSGRVVIQLKDQIKARAVLIHILGKAKTSWTVWERRNRPNTTSSGTQSVSILYSAEVIYLDIQLNVWQAGNSDLQVLAAGLHTFPFTFNLPPNCPPSFEGTIGFIRFYCKAKIDRPWKFDDITRTTFTVMPHFDLNAIYYASLPIVKPISKNIGILCFKHGRISGKISLPKSGYVPGENVILSIDVSNSTTRNVSRVEIALIETVTYTARRHNSLLEIGFGLEHPDIQKKHEHRNVVQYNEEFKVAPNSQAIYKRLLAIPPVVPSFNVCAIIQVDYHFKIKIITKGALGNSVTGEVPILIGTIPIWQNAAQNGQMPISNAPAPTPNAPTPTQGYLAPPQPSAPLAENMGPPPAYADSIFGHGTVEDTGDEKSNGFTPKYVYYNNFS